MLGIDAAAVSNTECPTQHLETRVVRELCPNAMVEVVGSCEGVAEESSILNVTIDASRTNKWDNYNEAAERELTSLGPPPGRVAQRPSPHSRARANHPQRPLSGRGDPARCGV